MEHIDFGLIMLRKEVLDEVSVGESADLGDLLSGLANRGEVAGFEVSERFYEIGSRDGLRETDEKIRQLRET
jgi:NDP-sugar pyrophosphorylase family protein